MSLNNGVRTYVGFVALFLILFGKLTVADGNTTLVMPTTENTSRGPTSPGNTTTQSMVTKEGNSTVKQTESTTEEPRIGTLGSTAIRPTTGVRVERDQSRIGETIDRLVVRLQSGSSKLTLSRPVRRDLTMEKKEFETAVAGLELDEISLEKLKQESLYRSVTKVTFALRPNARFAYEAEHGSEVMITGKLNRFTRFDRVNIDDRTMFESFQNLTNSNMIALCTYFGLYYNSTTKGTKAIKGATCNMDEMCRAEIEVANVGHLDHYENIKVFDKPELPVIVIAYLTRQMGFTYKDLVLQEQLENCLFFHPYNPKVCMETNWHNRVYPITHFVIERKFLKPSSSLTLCGIKKGMPGKIKGTWYFSKTRVRIHLGDPETAGRRRLLAVERRRRLPSRVNIRCQFGSHLIKMDKYAIVNEHRSLPNARSGFCNNSIFTNLPLGSEFGCYRVGSEKTHIQCKPHHHAYDGEQTCNITSPENCEDNHLCAEVTLNGQGIVTARAHDGRVELKHCLEKCSFSFKMVSDLEILFTCPSGEQHRFHSNIIDAQCPFRDRLGKYALYVCRATHRPTLLYTVILWLVAGILIVTTIIQLAVLCMKVYCYLVIKLKSKLDRGRGTCTFCNESVCSTEEWQRHEGCRRGKCPYCGCKGGDVDIKRHASVCLQRETTLEHDKGIIEIRRTPRWALKIGCLLNGMQGKPARGAWLVVLIVMLIILVKPVSGFATDDKIDGIWEEGIVEVTNCRQGCWYENDICQCEEKERGGSRRLLSETPTQKPTAAKSVKSHTSGRQIRRSLDVEAPWGTIHIPETYSPVGSVKHISLSWESSKVVGKKVILSGKSTALLKLNPRTSTSWEMSSEDSNEKKVLTLSILDYTQVYSSRFEYITGDRKVTTWAEGSCTGPCPKECGCSDPTCHTKEWPNSRNWRCNPTWCWGIGTGCSCCAAKVVDLYERWLVSLWQIEYLKTPVVACLEFDHDNRVCDVVEAGIEMQLGPVTVAFSDPFGEQRILPRRIAVYHKRDTDHEHVDLLHNHGIGGADQYCKLESCTHGTAGDYQITDPDALVYDDVTSMNYFKKIDTHNKEWMSWEGVNLGYYCNPGDWTTCTAENIVERNSESFKNRNDMERNFTKSHFFHSSRVYGAGNSLAMDLKARPIQSGGSINVYITVNNLELSSKKVALEGLRLQLRSCSGCFGCNIGAECQISMSITEPEQFHLHLKSLTPGITVPDTSFLVTSEEERNFKVRIFSIEKSGNFCLELFESKLCKTCRREDVSACTSLNLEDPKPVLLEHRSTLFSKSNKTCGGGLLSCWSESAGGLLKGVGSFLVGQFGSIFKGILSFLIPIALVAGLIFFSPQIFGLLRMCKKGRSVVGYKRRFYRPLTEDKEVNLTAEEKAFLGGVIGKKKE
uniref:M polyprotein n=1 Tax=Yogue virus TaxID=1712572 RepID=A0A7D5HQ14_9VIRU|nr:polyprotein [Yogue virus]